MASTTLSSSLIVSLIDRVTGPARGVSNALLGIQNAASGTAAGGFGKRLGKAIENNNRALAKARGGLVDAVAGFYALKEGIGAPLDAAAQFQTVMTDIGQKAEMPTNQLKGLGDQIQAVAGRTNQATMDIAKAVDTLIGFGAPQQVALAVAAPIGEAATAYNAATEDLSRAMFAITDNLKLPTQQATYALDIMAKAGKDGAFELKDMAKEFPALTASAQFLGMKGAKSVADLSAALEVARKGAADGTTAATNMRNLLQQLSAPRTVKNFAKMGVDLGAEMRKAAAAGESPIEHMLELIQKLTNGDPIKLGLLFQNQQALEALRPLLANMDDYRKIRADALAAQGTVEADYGDRIKTAAGVQKRFAADMQNLQIALGNNLIPTLDDAANVLGPIVSKIADWTAKNPQLTSTILKVTAGIVGFKIAMTGLNFIGLLGRGGALQMLSMGFNTVGRAAIAAKLAIGETLALQTALAAGGDYGLLAKLADGAKALVLAIPGVGAATSVLTALGAAVAGISAPVWAAAAAIAVAIASIGLVVYKYWDRISSFVSGFVGAIGKQLQPAIGLLMPVLAPMGAAAGAIGSGFNAASSAVSGLGAAIASFFSRELLSDAEKADMANAGADLANAMINSIKSAFDQFFTWLHDLPAMVLAAIGTIDLGAVIHLPSPQDLVSGIASSAQGAAQGVADGVKGMLGMGSSGAPAPAAGPKIVNPNPMRIGSPSGHRAAGGPVWPGGSFVVGEKGEERFTPKTAGTITPGGRGGTNGPIQIGPFHIDGARDAMAVAREVRDILTRELESILRGGHWDTGAR